MAAEETRDAGVGEVADRDDEWFVHAIETTTCGERLDYIAEIIKLDTFDGAQYTQNKKYMQRLRATWSARSRAIAMEQNDGRDGQSKTELPS